MSSKFIDTRQNACLSIGPIKKEEEKRPRSPVYIAEEERQALSLPLQLPHCNGASQALPETLRLCRAAPGPACLCCSLLCTML